MKGESSLALLFLSLDMRAFFSLIIPFEISHNPFLFPQDLLLQIFYHLL